MNARSWMARGAALLGASMLLAASVDGACYYLSSSGCGTGTGFCQESMIVCDVGYASTDTGCGKEGPLSNKVQRHCYKLIGVVTVACNAESPAGYESTGCAVGGVCCYASSRNQQSTGVSGDMMAPTGAACGCKETVGSS